LFRHLWTVVATRFTALAMISNDIVASVRSGIMKAVSVTPSKRLYTVQTIWKEWPSKSQMFGAQMAKQEKRRRTGTLQVLVERLGKLRNGI
jgi:hypothetical protein